MDRRHESERRGRRGWFGPGAGRERDKERGRGPEAFLHPPIDPFDQRMVEVGQGHAVYVEQCGNPEGFPVVVLHGGPGGGCSASMRRYFDPALFRAVLFDQRGCGRSRPRGCVRENTTWRLLDDMELIRVTLGIDRWVVYGGSWGATLGLLYAQACPDRVARLVLRGVCLMMRDELDWFYGGGAGRFWPETWERFSEAIPAGERDDLIRAYHARVHSGNGAVEARYSRIWSAWENALASMRSSGEFWTGPSEQSLAFAKLETHYFVNGGFLDRDDRILAEADRIAAIPGEIVQGRYDMICPPISAHRLAKAWPRGSLRIVGMAGHAQSEPEISAELVAIMDRVGGEAKRLGGYPEPEPAAPKRG